MENFTAADYLLLTIIAFLTYFLYQGFDAYLRYNKLEKQGLIDKQKYWYEVRFSYSKGQTQIVTFKSFISFNDQSDVLNGRKVKTQIQPLHKIPGLKDHLCNGDLGYSVTYLGYFKKT